MSVDASSGARAAAPLWRLPLLTLYLTERCNSRCTTCDYWRHGHRDLSLASVRELIPSLRRLQTETVLISGGEPLLNPDWFEIASLLRAEGLGLWLLTSGLSLAKHAARATQVFDSITVSLDGAWPETYERIRGVDAFDVVCRGIRATVSAGAAVGLRVTLQRGNYRELPDFVELAGALGVRQISFLAVDVATVGAFGREGTFDSTQALAPEDLPVFEALLHDVERNCAAAFERGLIAESPEKLRRLLQYFAAVAGQGAYPAVRCNAPEFSAVVDAAMRVRPCFFIPGGVEPVRDGRLEASLNGGGLDAVRAAIRDGRRPECATCVCPLWRSAPGADTLRLPSSKGVPA